MKKTFIKSAALTALALILGAFMLAGTVQAQLFVDNQDQTVTDTRTGLIWTKSADPLAGFGKLDWQEAMFQAKHFNLAEYTNWRVPTKDELSAFLPSFFSDQQEAIQMADTFVDLPADPRSYWTSSLSFNHEQAYVYRYNISVERDKHSTRISIGMSSFAAPQDQKIGTAWLVRDGHPENPVTRERADFLFDWLEAMFPEVLYPSPQPTLETGDDFYRDYPEADVSIKIMNNHLYFTDPSGVPHDLGGFMYWVGYSKAETIFNWLEAQPSLQELMSPAPQATQVEDDSYFRMYPDTGFIVYTKQGRLRYTTDNYATSYDVGSVDEWLRIID